MPLRRRSPGWRAPPEPRSPGQLRRRRSAHAAARLLYGERLLPINRLGLVLAVVAVALISYQELGLVAR